MVKIAVVGDYQERSETHVATNAALHDAAGAAPPPEVTWLGTAGLERHGVELLTRFDGVFIAPGGAYESMTAALAAIGLARTSGIPLLGTCAGFQHVVIEYARNAAGIVDAAHAETDAEASSLVISALTCSLVGQTFSVDLVPGTCAAEAYGTTPVTERYYCRFGLNPEYLEPLTASGLVVSGVDGDDEPRIVELPDHPFFVGTLFVPQTSSAPGLPHPLVRAFVAAASAEAARS